MQNDEVYKKFRRIHSQIALIALNAQDARTANRVIPELSVLKTQFGELEELLNPKANE